MPLTQKGTEILKKMEDTYGSKKKAEQVFYSSANSGKITGVHEGRRKFQEAAQQLRQAMFPHLKLRGQRSEVRKTDSDF